MERELQLRSHIRGLLLDYCRANITEDYVTFTQDAVQTLLSDRISLVSLEDPSSISLPVDPMDTLFRGLDAPIIPEEKWMTDADSLGHIRKSMKLSAMPLATSTCWHEVDPYERAVESFLLVSPILSSRALKQTPKFGESKATTLPDSLRSTLGAYTLVPVKVPDIPTPPLPTLEEILDVQYKIEPSLHREMVSLIRSVHTSAKPIPDQINSAVESFLRSDSPTLRVVETTEVPIFPRSSWPGLTDGSSMSSTKMPRSMGDLRCLAPTVQIEEEDLSMEHMRVVGGWTVYLPISSPSPTPSLALGDTSSQVDELFPPSPPAGSGNGVSILELETLKMGEVQIPRQSRIGHADESLLQHPQSLASLLPQHRISLVDLTSHKGEPRLLECTDETTIASSMLGQPPSNFDADDNERECHADDDDLVTDLRLIWSKAGCDQFEIILQDGINESKTLLFEVPELPPPTAHKPWEQLPRDLKSLASSLGMVKGIRPLNLELSWVPFKYISKVPTNEEVSRVSDDILGGLTILVDQNSSERDEVLKLLSDLAPPQSSELVSNLAFVECTHPEDFAVAEILYSNSIRPHQLVLTRDERRRISRTGADLFNPPTPDSFQSMGRTGDDVALDLDGGEPLFEELVFNSQTPQRDCTEVEHLQLDGCEGDDEELVPAPAKRRRLGDFLPADKSLLESPLELLGTDRMRNSILPPTAELTSPRQTELLDDRRLHKFSPARQNVHILPDVTSLPHDPIRPNLSDSAYHFVPSDTGRAYQLGHAPVTGRRREFAEFLAFRGVRLDAPLAVATTEISTGNPPPIETLPILKPMTTEVPPDLVDNSTVQLPAADSLPASRHQYLTSLDLLQKNALCRCLSDLAAIDLVEREFLGGVDLIIDQDTAILFLPLSVVPSECEGLVAGISDISWRYSYIMVVFEAFLVSQAFSDNEDNRITWFAFTEPISKSVKKLKRSLVIAEGVGTKSEDCLLSWAFAKNIEEAARLARVYGDMAESRDKTGGLLWQERWWLGEREAEDSPLVEFEDESDLAMITGMNAFTACLILSQMSSDQFLSLTPQERTEKFGQLLGAKRMVELNRTLEQSAAALSSSLPASDLRDSSSTQL